MKDNTMEVNTMSTHTRRTQCVVRQLSITACFQILVFVLVSFVCVQGSVDPTSFACTTYNSTVIQVSWSMATDVSVAGYYLYLQRTDGLKTQEGPGITLAARNYISYTFYGLGYFAQYDISINSYSNLGANNTVYTQTCTTLSDNPDLSNFNLTCEGISYYEISCTWGSLDAVYWNGVPYGWQLGYISYYNDEYTYVNFNSTATLSYTIQSLQFDTKYLINIRSVNTGGFMGPYSSTNSKTLGWPKNVENETRYYCYEAIPGHLEFSWHEMPCTIYSGTIAGLLLISLLLLMLCCCMCCCKGGGKDNSKTEINIFNEENNEYYGGDDDYEDSDEDEVPSEDEDDDEYEDMSDGDESPDKAPPIAKKKKLSDDEIEDDETEDNEESEEEIEDTEDEGEDSETDVEIYAGLTEDEKKAKKEERAEAKKKKKEEKAKKREEAKKRKEEEKKRKDEERKEKIRERMKKRNAAMAGAATLKTIDETKKEKKSEEKVKPTKKKLADSDDEESEGYYEDWNPDADENPDVEVNKVSNKDANTPDSDKKNNKKDKKKDKIKEKRGKSAKNKDKTGRKSASKEDDGDDSEDDDEDYDEYDDTDEEEYESSEGEDTQTSSKQVKTKSGKNPRKDSGRGSASSNNSLGKNEKSKAKSSVKFQENEKEPKKKGGFLSNLFGTSKPKESNVSTNYKYKTNQSQQGGKKVDYGDWDDDDADLATSNNKAGIQGLNTINKDTNSTVIGGLSSGYGNNNSSTNGNPVNNYDSNVTLNAPIFVNSNPSNGTNNYNRDTGDNYGQSYDSGRPPPGYGQNPNGKFHPFPGNFNRNIPQGYIRNSDGSVQRSTSNRPEYSNNDNNPPPGYAKNFDGSFYPVRGNTNPVVPPGYVKNPDGTIYKNPQTNTIAKDKVSYPPPGYGKNPDGTFFPLPGNVNPTLPQGYSRNHDGTIYQTTNQAPYSNTQHNNNIQNYQSSDGPPPGYNRNPDGTFYPKPGNRNPDIPPGYVKNPDGSIYKSANYQNHQNSQSTHTTHNQNANAPPGYGQNPDGTYRPLPGNTNLGVPTGFAKDNRGNIYRSSDPSASNLTNVLPPQGYAKNPDGSFRPLAANRNNAAPLGFTKNPDGSIFHDPYQNTTNESNKNSFGPPPGYGTNADGTYFPLPSNRNPAVPAGFVKNPNGTVSKAANPIQQSNRYGGNTGPPAGYAPTTEGTYRALPGNRNPVIPRGYIQNSDGSIQRSGQIGNVATTNTEIPQGYAKNPDGTFRPLPTNRNPTVPQGFTKNPDGTIRRNRTNAPQNDNFIPSGYGKNADGTFYPLKSNPNPVVPDGFRKNPDGTIARLPQYKNNPGTYNSYPVKQKTGIQNNNNVYTGNRHQNPQAIYPYGPADLDQPDLPDERDKFNDLFAAKAKRKAAEKRTLAERGGNRTNSTTDVPPNYTGDGEDIFSSNPNDIDNQLRKSKNDGPTERNKNSLSNPTGANQNPFHNSDGLSKNPYSNAVGTNQNNYGNTLGTNKNLHGNTDGNKQNPYGNEVGNNQNPFQNPTEKNNANSNPIGKPSIPSKHQHLGKNQSNDAYNAGAHIDPFNGNVENGTNFANMPPEGMDNFGKQQKNLGQNRLDNQIPNNINNIQRSQPIEGNLTKNPTGLDNQGNNQHGHPSIRDGRQPYSFGDGKQVDTVQGNRKPISFRENDPRYEEYNQRHPNPGENFPDDQSDPRHGRNDNRHPNTNNNNHGDASDTEVLPDEGPTNKRKPIARFRGANQTPAWGSKPKNDNKADKSGKKTPIMDLKPQDRQELIEPEPVLGSDRLGNKFPFLNIDKKRESLAAGNKNGKNDGDKPENRRKSEPGMVLRGRELVDKKDLSKRDFPPLPNTLTGEAGAIAKSDDLAGLKPETRAQIFYGFGVGRWRQAAAKWLTKWKMKKKPVKTAKASWD